MNYRQSRVFLLFLLLPLLNISSARAEVIGFDDLDPFYSHNEPLYDYAGLTWYNFYSMRVRTQYPDGNTPGYVAGMVTEPFVAYNFDGEPAEFSSAAPFTLVSVYLTAAWQNGLKITVEGFRDSERLYEQTVTLSSTAPQLFTLDYYGVNRVTFTPVVETYADSRTHFVMDDLDIVNGGIGPIPVTIDIKPGDGQNVINPDSKGVIPVAILSTGSFDAAEVDPLMVSFGPGEAPALKAHIEDVNRDGLLDMLLFFATRQSGIKRGDTAVKLKARTLMTKTSGDRELEGTDSIRTVPSK